MLQHRQLSQHSIYLPDYLPDILKPEPDILNLGYVQYHASIISNCNKVTIVKFSLPTHQSTYPSTIPRNYIDKNIEVVFGTCCGNCEDKCNIATVADTIIKGFSINPPDFPQKEISPPDFISLSVYNPYSGGFNLDQNNFMHNKNIFVAAELGKITSFD